MLLCAWHKHIGGASDWLCKMSLLTQPSLVKTSSRVSGSAYYGMYAKWVLRLNTVIFDVYSNVRGLLTWPDLCHFRCDFFYYIVTQLATHWCTTSLHRRREKVFIECSPHYALWPFTIQKFCWHFISPVAFQPIASLHRRRQEGPGY